MKPLILFAACLVMASNAFGRIGETLEECNTRYGKVTMIGDEAHFKKKGMSIIIWFRDKKAALIKFLADHKMSDVEIDTLLKANGGASEWIKVSETKYKGAWGTADNKVIAWYKENDGFFGLPHLTIVTQQEADLRRKEDEEKDKKTLKDF
jgi:hypothetical protein